MRFSKVCSVFIISAFIIGCGDKEDGEAEEDTDSMDMSTDDVMTEYDPEADQYDAEEYYEEDVEPSPSELPSYGPDDIVAAITDRDQNVRLLLTPSNLTMKLSAAAMSRLRSQVNSRDLKDDLKNALLASIQEVALNELEEAVEKQRVKTSRHQIQYPLQQINSIHYQNGRLWIDIEREKRLSFDDIKTQDGRSVLTNFDEWDAQAFADAFESL